MQVEHDQIRELRLREEQETLSALIAGEDVWPRFNRLFSKHIHFELVCHGIAPGQERDDILQDLALRLMQHDWRIIRRHLELDLGYSFTALLQSVINSVVQNYRRRNKHWNRRVDHEADVFAIIGNSSRPSDNPADSQLHRARDCEVLWRVVGDCRNDMAYQILYLRFIEDESVSDIARRLGLSPNAVSQRLRYYCNRARSIMHRELTP